ncbi:MAG: hypothetical protein U0075_10855 [Thermomicrobiales bacterium]
MAFPDCAVHRIAVSLLLVVTPALDHRRDGLHPDGRRLRWLSAGLRPGCALRHEKRRHLVADLAFCDWDGVWLMLSAPEALELDYPSSVLSFRVTDLDGALCDPRRTGRRL